MFRYWHSSGSMADASHSLTVTEMEVEMGLGLAAWQHTDTQGRMAPGQALLLEQVTPLPGAEAQAKGRDQQGGTL